MPYFRCGCCGSGFTSSHAKQKKFDQDTGFGICERCDQWKQERERAAEDKAIALLRSGLSKPELIERFDSYDRALQLALVGKAIEDGLITYGIGPA